MIHVITNKAASFKTLFPKSTNFTDAEISKHSPEAGDFSYFDISGFSAAEIKTAVTKIKKSCKDSLWGVIDSKGIVKDTAQLFFDGASDYIGSSFIKETETIDNKRLKEAASWRRDSAVTAAAANAAKIETNGEASGFLKSGIKLPAASAFPGWKKIETGKTMPFYFLYCSLQGKVPLDSRLGDKVIAQIHQKFAALLSSSFKEADGLLWVDTGKDFLFLLPPRIKSAEAAIKTCISMIAAAPLSVMEIFGITIPASYIFALHYGSISYKPPGKTGTVVSDAVNSIFHLGAKKSEPGRLTVSAAIPDVSIPKQLWDLFIPNGEYEGNKIWHTKKFNYAKAWM